MTSTRTPRRGRGPAAALLSSITSSEEVLALPPAAFADPRAAPCDELVDATRTEIRRPAGGQEKQKQEEQTQKANEEFTKESNELSLQERKQAMKAAAAGGGSGGGGAGGGDAPKPAKAAAE